MSQKTKGGFEVQCKVVVCCIATASNIEFLRRLRPLVRIASGMTVESLSLGGSCMTSAKLMFGVETGTFGAEASLQHGGRS